MNARKKVLILYFSFVLGLLWYATWKYTNWPMLPRNIASLFSEKSATSTGNITTSFNYKFTMNGELEEAGSPDESSSPYWWLNSGGAMIINDGVGETYLDQLASYNKWRIAYSLSNAADTDGGYYPQNVFRLITRKNWQNFQEEISFYISKYNVSKSQNRNESNGVLLFTRYQDEDNLYYGGLRVDGNAVIKKKQNGIYYTIGTKVVFENGLYDRDTNPNLIPIGQWIGIHLQTENSADNTAVHITLSLDRYNQGHFIPILDVVDDGKSFGEEALTHEGMAGIRSDFMDIKFDNFKASKLLRF